MHSEILQATQICASGRQATLVVCLLLIFLAKSAFSQALISDRIREQDEVTSEPPGYVYPDSRRFEDEYTFEIGFRIDSSRFDPSQAYACGSVPTGYWLYDRYPDDDVGGRWMIAVGGNLTLCYVDEPQFEWGVEDWTAEFPDIELDTCYRLTAARDSGGRLSVSLGGKSVVVAEYAGGVYYQAGSNGVGVAREVNGYHEAARYDSFPGEIFYLNDNGREIDFGTTGSVSGRGAVGPNPCSQFSPDTQPAR